MSYAFPNPLATRRVGIALFRGRSLLSRLIRWQTRGEYSHAALLFSDGLFVEAREGVGVRFSQAGVFARPGERVDWFAVMVTPTQEDDLRAFCYQQRGCQYDYRAIVAFVTRTHLTTEHATRWFCSELVYAAFQAAGIRLLRGTCPWEVSPALLARSPLLQRAPAKTFSL